LFDFICHDNLINLSVLIIYDLHHTILKEFIKEVFLSFPQLEIKNKALDHFKQAKPFFEEGSLGYAQVHVIIGFKIVGEIKNK